MLTEVKKRKTILQVFGLCVIANFGYFSESFAQNYFSPGRGYSQKKNRCFCQKVSHKLTTLVWEGGTPRKKIRWGVRPASQNPSLFTTEICDFIYYLTKNSIPYLCPFSAADTAALNIGLKGFCWVKTLYSHTVQSALISSVMRLIVLLIMMMKK